MTFPSGIFAAAAATQFLFRCLPPMTRIVIWMRNAGAMLAGYLLGLLVAGLMIHMR